MIGLDKQWAVRAISAVGNYGEIFERNIGVNTPLGLARGLERAVDRRRNPVLTTCPLDGSNEAAVFETADCFSS